MLDAMRTAVHASKALSFTKPSNYKPISHHEALYMATLGGAKGIVCSVHGFHCPACREILFFFCLALAIDNQIGNFEVNIVVQLDRVINSYNYTAV